MSKKTQTQKQKAATKPEDATPQAEETQVVESIQQEFEELVEEKQQESAPDPEPVADSPDTNTTSSDPEKDELIRWLHKFNDKHDNKQELMQLANCEEFQALIAKYSDQPVTE
jgi:hypothetical protein